MKCDLCDEESDEVERVTDHSELAAGAYCPACLGGAMPVPAVPGEEVPRFKVVEQHENYVIAELNIPAIPAGFVRAMIQERYVAWMKNSASGRNEDRPNVLLMSPEISFRLGQELRDDKSGCFPLCAASDVTGRGGEYWGMVTMMVVGEGEPFLAVGRI